MDYFGLLVSILCIGCQLHYAQSLCGTQDITNSIGRHEYNRHGKNPTEKCSYSFIPADENSIVILKVQKFSAFRKGTPENAYLTLPDGNRVHFHNHQHLVGNCFRFSKKNFQTNPCLEELANTYCSTPTTEVEEWPPTLNSTVLTSHQSDGSYSYDMDFTFFYMYVSCPRANVVLEVIPARNETKSTETTSGDFFVSFIAVSAVLAVVLVATIILLVVLVKSSRKAKEPAKADLERNSPPNNNLENGQDIEEDIYENPNYSFTTEPPPDARNSTYSRIDLNSTLPLPQRPGSENYNDVFLPSNQVVNNVLYHNF